MNRRLLAVAAGALVLSGGLKIGELAVAQGLTPEAEESPALAAEPALSPSLLQAFAQRESRIVAQEAALESRLRALEVIETRVTQEREALVQAKNDLSQTMSLAKTAAQQDVASLAQIYQEMKPEQAAAIFSAMEPQFAAGFLALMTPPTAAAILAQLEPERAYGVTAIIAGRNLGAPTQ